MLPETDGPPDPEEVSAGVFAALADPNRRAILASMAQYGPSSATDLSGRLSITRQGIAKHLALLADAGLVTTLAGGGRRVLYRHRSEPIKVAQSFLAALAADWDGPLGRLAAFLDDPGDPQSLRSPQSPQLP
jgi:DNA-binding transcriptional ArsR family regulator